VHDHEWKSLRNVITPTFSALKMKAVILETLLLLYAYFQMTSVLDDCGKSLVKNLGNAIDLHEDAELKRFAPKRYLPV
jgi:hypothetical protein